jgi:hypothetical protein
MRKEAAATNDTTVRLTAIARFRTEDRYVGGLVGVAYAEAFKARRPLLATDPTAFVKTPFG